MNLFQVNWKYLIFLAGFTAICGQILLLRQFEALFGGSELTVGFFFAAWFIFTGAGAVLGKIAALRERTRWLPLLQSIILILTLLSMQTFLTRDKLNFGLSPSPSAILQATGIVFLFTFLTGVIFTAVIRYSGEASGRIYLWESLGAAGGGILAAVLVGWLNQYQIALLLIFSSMAVCGLGRKVQVGDLLLYGILAAALGFMLDLIIAQSMKLDDEVILCQDTKYGRVILTRSAEQYNVYQNGALAFSVPDQLPSEEAAHYALLAHRNPRTVLLIGGGFSGTIGEILKYHSVEKVDYLEIDSRLINILRRKLPIKSGGLLSDKRLNIIERDYRSYLKSAGMKYDVIVQNLPQPLNSSLNRGYTVDFFRYCKAALNAGGIFCFSQNGAGDFISYAQAEIFACAQRTAEQVFHRVAVIPANKTWFLCSQSDFTISLDSYLEQMRERGVETAFVSAYYIFDWLNTERLDYVRRTIAGVKSVKLNYDFHPLGYLSNTERYYRQHYPSSVWFFNLSRRVNLPVCLVIIVIMMAGFLLIFTRRGGANAVYSAGFFGGFSQMGGQLLVLLGFQSIFGFMYYQQAVLIGAFMAGAAGGAYFGGRWRLREKSVQWAALLKAQSSILLMPAAIMVTLVMVKLLGGISANLVTLIAVLSGWAGGLQYSIGAAVLSGEEAAKGGRFYACDLAGAALGSAATGLLLLPVLGFYQTAALLSFCGVMPLIFILMQIRRRIW